MKNLILTSALILLVISVKAQSTEIGAPKELTCTEKAFNFSFAVGQKLKISSPKMGPLEAATYETDYMPAWALKANAIKPEKYSASLSIPNSFRTVNKSRYLLPAFSVYPMPGYPTVNYPAFKPFSL